jgi:ABC-2 type transport system permease protein
MSDTSGALTLTRFALRRDRIVLPIWILVMVSMVTTTATAGKDLFPTAASRLEAASAINDSPSFVAMLGRIYDVNSLGSLSLIKLTTFGAAMVAVIAIMLVVRHTRREEENGRLELLGSTVVGRQAALAAALSLAFVSMLVIGVLTAVMLAASGLPTAGSWAFGMAWATTGMVFAAVAAVAAQLTISARSANGIALSVLALTYAFRAIGDTQGTAQTPTFWSWLSPIGWGQQVRAFAGERWWALLLPLVLTALASSAAFALAARRDLGAGLLPDRAGAATAAPRFASPLALAWRLQRGMLLGWAVGYALMGVLTGNLASSVGSFASSDQMRDFIRKLGGTQVLTDAFFAYMFSFTALLTAAYGISVAMRLRSEEEPGHTEQLLATAVPRIRWLASHVVVAVAGTTLLSLLAGVTAGLANWLQTGSTADFGAIVAGVLVYLPAVWVLTGIVVLLFGFLPRLVTYAWGLLVAFFLLDELGPLLSLPSWTMNLSPFAHIPKLPGATMTWTPVVALTLLAAALVIAGALRFRQRDLTTA